MDAPPSDATPETLAETASASSELVTRVQKLLTATQAIVFSSRLRIRNSRELIDDANALRTPAAHPMHSREGFLPSETLLAA